MSGEGDRSLVDYWKAGDERAAQELFDRYVDRLVALARRRLNQRLARRVDPEDIVQSVFRSFFARAKAGRFTIRDQDDLVKLLYRLTFHKTLRQISHHQAAKRDVNQEAGAGLPLLDDSFLADQEPTPDMVNCFLDQMEHFMRQLKPQERQILEMRMQGYGTGEIAKQLGIYERKITRIIDRIRGLAEKQELAPQDR